MTIGKKSIAVTTGFLVLCLTVQAKAQGNSQGAPNSGSSLEQGQNKTRAGPQAKPRPKTPRKSKKAALTSRELLQILSGNSLAGNGKIKDPKPPFDWIAHYRADGTLTMKLKPAWGSLILVGRWWMKSGGLTCRIFTKPQKKPEGCWRFFREGDFYRFVPASGQAVEGRAVRLQGNALKK